MYFVSHATINALHIPPDLWYICMKKVHLVIIVFLLGGIASISLLANAPTGAPPYDTAFDEPVNMDRFAWLKDWQRPNGPPRVGLQAGHWKNNELPDELASLRGSTGSQGGGKAEWEVNLAIAEKTKALLEARGVIVDILPATVPVSYWADAFVAIHADGNENTTLSGFKVASPRRDMNGSAGELAAFIAKHYEEETALTHDPNVSRNMHGYYAFAWWRREHAIHPKTAALIIETGFLTSPSDRQIIVNAPESSARGIALGALAYLEKQGLL